MSNYRKISYLDNYGAITGYGSKYWAPGLDVDLKKGDNVTSPKDGVVVHAGEKGGFGNQVAIKDKRGNVIMLSHLDRVDTRVGDRIREGQLVGLGGNTGKTYSPGGGDGSHLDITVQKNGQYLDAKQAEKYVQYEPLSTFDNFDQKIDKARSTGRTDTDILNYLSKKDSDIAKKIKSSRDKYGSGNINNDRDLINFLSQKYTGKMPTVESVPLPQEQEPKTKGFFTPQPSEGGRFDDIRVRDVAREVGGVAKNVWGYLKGKKSEIVEKQKEVDRKVDEGEINKLTGIYSKRADTVWEVGEMAFDTALTGLKGFLNLSSKLTGQEEDLDDVQKEIVKAGKEFLNSESGKSTIELIQTGQEGWEYLKENYPNLAENVKSTAKLADVLPLWKAGSAGKKVIGEVIKASGDVAKTGGKVIVKPIKGLGETVGEVASKTGKGLKEGVEKQVRREVEDIISPKITSKVKDKKLKQGLIDDKGKVSLDDYEKSIADVVAPYIKKSNTPQKNIKNIMDEVGKEGDKVGKALKANDVIFNKAQLKKKLNDGLADIDDAMFDPKRIQKVKDDIINDFLGYIKKHNLSGLWQARKKFDIILESRLKAFSGSFTLKKDIARTLRTTVNDFIISKSPTGNIYKEGMDRMSKMYRAVDNISDKVLSSSLNQTTLAKISKKVSAVSHKIGGLPGLGIGVGLATLPALISSPVALTSLMLYGSYKGVKSKAFRKALGNFLEKGGKFLNKEERKHLENLAKTLDNSIKSQEGFIKLPRANNRKQGGVYQTSKELDEIRSAKKAIDKDGNVVLPKKKDKLGGLKTTNQKIEQQITKAKASGKSFEEFAKNPVYHGSNIEDIKEFKFMPAKREIGAGFKKDVTSQAIFFSKDKNVAKLFAENRTEFFETGKPTIYERYITTKKTADFTDLNNAQKIMDKAGLDAGEIFGLYENSPNTIKELIEEGEMFKGDLFTLLDDKRYIDKLKALGYDSAKILEKNGESIAVFNPSQIKTKSQLKQLWDNN